MNSERFFQFLLIFGTALSMLGTLLFFKQGPLPLHASLVAQNVNDYLGPTQPTPGERIRVQVLINDDPSPEGVQIVDAEFNQNNIPLKPRDVYGFRGQASLQAPPGHYKLKWTVRKNRLIWPRTISHEEEVTLDPRDLWIQITITGDKASIS